MCYITSLMQCEKTSSLVSDDVRRNLRRSWCLCAETFLHNCAIEKDPALSETIILIGIGKIMPKDK